MADGVARSFDICRLLSSLIRASTHPAAAVGRCAGICDERRACSWRRTALPGFLRVLDPRHGPGLRGSVSLAGCVALDAESGDVPSGGDGGDMGDLVCSTLRARLVCGAAGCVADR